MQPRVLKCPQCGAPLSPSKFARQVVCVYCKTQVQIDPTLVHAAGYRRAHAEWVALGMADAGPRVDIDGQRFRLVGLLAHGEVSEVYAAERDRWPTERVLIKICRSRDDRALCEAERDVLQQLQASDAKGAESFGLLLPQPLLVGDVREGPSAGAPALVLRWLPGFRRTFRDARHAYGAGIEPIVSIWMWRRLLEALTFLHGSGVVHGAVLPRHLLIQDGDHGLRLVGFSCAGASGSPLRAVVSEDERFYPKALRDGGPLSLEMDLQMSASAIAFVLGGEGDDLRLPGAVPAPLAALLSDVRAGKHPPTPWELREQVGTLGRQLFGAPSFHPLTLP